MPEVALNALPAVDRLRLVQMLQDKLEPTQSLPLEAYMKQHQEQVQQKTNEVEAAIGAELAEGCTPDEVLGLLTAAELEEIAYCTLTLPLTLTLTLTGGNRYCTSRE